MAERVRAVSKSTQSTDMRSLAQVEAFQESIKGTLTM